MLNIEYPIIIRKDKDLLLTMNKEKVYFLWQYGRQVFNSLNYDEISNKFNQLKGE